LTTFEYIQIKQTGGRKASKIVKKVEKDDENLDMEKKIVDESKVKDSPDGVSLPSSANSSPPFIQPELNTS
jgi:hypothetical protein